MPEFWIYTAMSGIIAMLIAAVAYMIRQRDSHITKTLETVFSKLDKNQERQLEIANEMSRTVHEFKAYVKDTFALRREFERHESEGIRRTEALRAIADHHDKEMIKLHAKVAQIDSHGCNMRGGC